MRIKRYRASHTVVMAACQSEECAVQLDWLESWYRVLSDECWDKGEVEAEKKRSGKWLTGKGKELPIANSDTIQA